MKKGYQRLLIFEFILFVFLFLNSFVWNILDKNIIFLLILIVIFKFVFGVEKDRHRYVKDVIFDIVIVLLVSFLLYYLFGILIGFYRIDNYYNWYGLRTFILPTIFSIILKEYLRYQLLSKSEGNNLLIVTTVILFLFIDISTAIYYGKFSNSYDIFMFFALTFLPRLSNNITCSYITIKLGYKPNIVWLLFVELYIYFIPIVPNPNEYMLSIIRFVFPLIILWRVYSLFEKIKDSEIIRDYNKNNKFILIFPTLLVILLVYITSGYFKYYAVAIGSGSMVPAINRGDIVIIEKIESDYGVIGNNEIIAFFHDNVMFIHRVVNIIEKENKYYFYTKGDANEIMDNFSVHEEDIVGVIRFKIPYIGLPTVWLSEL